MAVKLNGMNTDRKLELLEIYKLHAELADKETIMKNLVVTEEIWKEGNMYTAYCPELDVVSCGTDIEEARSNLLEVIEIQLEESARLGTLKAFLEDAGYDLNTPQSTLQLDKQVIAFNQRTIPLGVF